MPSNIENLIPHQTQRSKEPNSELWDLRNVINWVIFKSSSYKNLMIKKAWFQDPLAQQKFFKRNSGKSNDQLRSNSLLPIYDYVPYMTYLLKASENQKLCCLVRKRNLLIAFPHYKLSSLLLKVNSWELPRLASDFLVSSPTSKSQGGILRLICWDRVFGIVNSAINLPTAVWTLSTA